MSAFPAWTYTVNEQLCCWGEHQNQRIATVSWKVKSLFSKIMTWTPSHHLHNVQLSKCYLYQSQRAFRNSQQVTQRERIKVFLFLFFPPVAGEAVNEETKLEVQSWFSLWYDIWLRNTKGSHQKASPRDRERLQLASKRKPPALAPLSVLISNSLTHCSYEWSNTSDFMPLTPQFAFQSQVTEVNILRNTSLCVGSEKLVSFCITYIRWYRTVLGEQTSLLTSPRRNREGQWKLFSSLNSAPYKKFSDLYFFFSSY